MTVRPFKRMCKTSVCFHSGAKKNIWRTQINHRSPAGPRRAPPLHPGEPHSQKRRGSAAALPEQGLHAHAPPSVRHLPAEGRVVVHALADRCLFPRQTSCSSRECAGGRRRAGEAGQGAGEHVHPPGCRSSAGERRDLHSAFDGDTRWAESRRTSSTSFFKSFTVHLYMYILYISILKGKNYSQ